MYREITKILPEKFAPYAPFPPADVRAFWEGLEPDLAASLVAAGESRAGYGYPALPASLYLDFKRTGNRARFEERYFSRRRALNDFVLAECVAGDGRFLDGVVDGLDALCSECGWQLPAHNSYVRDTPQLPLPSATRPVLDLFACETGAQLSVTAYLLGSRLDAVSPFVRERVAAAVRQRILEPYLGGHFWWMGDGDEPMNNWTPWCTQNVLVAAGLSDIDGGTMRAVIEKAANGLDSFLKDYGDDGCCSEGAQYYRHAGLCLLGATEILEALAPSRFAPLYREPKIKNIAEYIRNAYVGNGYYVNFADCSPLAGPAGAREFLFGKRVGSPALQAFAAGDYMEKGDKTLPEEINLLYRLQSVAMAPEIREYAEGARSANRAARGALPAGAGAAPLSRAAPAAGTSAEGAPPPDELAAGQAASGAQSAPRADAPLPDAWYPSVGLLVARSESLCLAVKAGGNDDSHNHNDTGSFTLYKNGRPCVIDLGVETYTAKTFSPRRYEIWTMQSSWHNLPSFGPHMQEAGPEYRARDVEYVPTPDGSSLSMEIAGAWGRDSGAESYRRRVALSRSAGRVTVEDRYRGKYPATMHLLTELQPEPCDGGFRIGSLADVTVEGASGEISIESVKIEDPRLAIAWKDRIYRVGIPFGEELKLIIE